MELKDEGLGGNVSGKCGGKNSEFIQIFDLIYFDHNFIALAYLHLDEDFFFSFLL